MPKLPKFNDEEIQKIIADLVVSSLYCHAKTLKGDTAIVTPCRCLGTLPEAMCLALVLVDAIKHYRGDIELEAVPELQRLL
jgi:hypothetical protein